MRDTSSHMERIHIMLLRQAGVEKRFSLLRSLSATIIQLSKQAIQKANPELNDQEVALKFVAHHYGADLAKKLRSYLMR